MATLLVIEHEEGRPPGLLGEAARDAGVALWRVAAGAGEPLPGEGELDGVDGLVVLGGSMGVGDLPQYPHLGEVMELIRRAAARELPALGICLGSQLAAQALGGRAHRGAAGTRVLQWHHDTFDPPPGATLLARGDHYPNQAFRLGSVVAVQFHPEVDADLISLWYGESSTPPPILLEELVDGADRYAARARRMLDAFCAVVRDQDQEAAAAG